MRKYFLILRHMLSMGGEKPIGLLIRSSFLFIIIAIFSKLWDATDLSGTQYTQEMLIWYLSTTEVIIISLPLIQFEIESHIRSGDIVYFLARPISYLWMSVAESLGILIFRFSILAISAFCFAAFLSKGWIPPFYSIFFGMLTAFMASIVLLFFHITIGLVAFKIEDCAPLFWLWQRCSFLLGGLILPLEWYPQTIQKIALFTPFSALIGGPAQAMIGANGWEIGQLFVSIISWGFIGVFTAHKLYQTMFRKIRINGG